MTPRVEIEVIGARESVAVSALLDTGFDGDVCIPTDIAVTLGLELVTRQWAEYADGRRARELAFAGQVRFLNSVRPAEIVLTESEETLVGTGMLDQCELFISFVTGEIRIQPAK